MEFISNLGKWQEKPDMFNTRNFLCSNFMSIGLIVFGIKGSVHLNHKLYIYNLPYYESSHASF